MTNFLPAGFISDSLEEICSKLADLHSCMETGDRVQLQKKLQEMEKAVLEIRSFIEQLSCQPLVYTGPGTTEEIINRLEWALIFSEGIDSEVLLKAQQDLNRRKASYK